ncbi:hypothetical protein BC828DRAFT_300268 [Blastocladiella britannica]|nr:hypothetical protein BC828DRAFT_300268 [Blastocladiella britannica]
MERNVNLGYHGRHGRPGRGDSSKMLFGVLDHLFGLSDPVLGVSGVIQCGVDILPGRGGQERVRHILHHRTAEQSMRPETETKHLPPESTLCAVGITVGMAPLLLLLDREERLGHACSGLQGRIRTRAHRTNFRIPATMMGRRKTLVDQWSSV